MLLRKQRLSIGVSFGVSFFGGQPFFLPPFSAMDFLTPENLFALLAPVWVLSLAWVYRDAKQEGRNAVYITAVVAVFWPFGLLGWSLVKSQDRTKAA